MFIMLNIHLNKHIWIETKNWWKTWLKNDFIQDSELDMNWYNATNVPLGELCWEFWIFYSNEQKNLTNILWWENNTDLSSIENNLVF